MKTGKSLSIIALPFLSIALIFLACGGGGGGSDGGSSTFIGPNGGVIEVTDPTDPLYGLKVDIPAGALSNNTNITVETASDTIPLPQGLTTSGVIISLSPENLSFNKLISIIIPYDSSEVPIVVSYNQSTNAYEILPISEIDEQNKTVTVKTTHFSMIGKISDWIIDELDTNFSVSEDAFSIENTYEYFDEGACWGFSSYSKWYFDNKKITDGDLSKRYSDFCEYSLIVDAQGTLYPEKVLEAAISLAVHLLKYEDRDLITFSEVFAALLLTGNPQVLTLSPPLFSPGDSHAVLVYAISPSSTGSIYHIYDNRDNSKSYQITFDKDTRQFDDYDDYDANDDFTEFFYFGRAVESEMQEIYDSYGPKFDTNCDGCIDMVELMVAIGKWKAGEISMEELMEAIAIWKTCNPNGEFTNSIGMTFNLIPAGTFTMGSPLNELGRFDDETQHEVTLSQPFYMQTTEVTQAQWVAVMGSNPSYFNTCGDDCPVEMVSWDDVQTFITSLNAFGEGTYRLPTEAEWEYAARALSTTAFANGDITAISCGFDPNLDSMGWYCYNSNNNTQLVAQKNPNAWGLYDMHGNVFEWCQDWYGSYPSGSVTDPTGPSSGLARVVRGGSFYYSTVTCRSAWRSYQVTDGGNNYYGFRLVRNP